VSFTVRIQSEDFDAGSEAAALARGRRDIGAVVTFCGYCRDEGGRLSALELEHYPGMAEEEIGRVVAQARERWPLDGVTVIHRFGKIAPGAQIVLVVVASSHRAAAFAGAEFVMDYLKTRAPFWKKEHRVDGTQGEWVAATDGDERAAQRWLDRSSG
jgi:molybdopterin synthase catalytic subunit